MRITNFALIRGGYFYRVRNKTVTVELIGRKKETVPLIEADGDSQADRLWRSSSPGALAKECEIN